MQRNPDGAQRSFDAVQAGTLRRRILDYIADQGGELRSDSGQGLRRQICDALGERPTAVSQALIALEKAGLLGPSSTWTYMINDNPMGDIFERLTRGIKRMVR